MADSTPQKIPDDLKNAAEKELAKSGRLPVLVAILDKKGDVHCYAPLKGEVEGGDVELVENYKEPDHPHEILNLAFSGICRGDPEKLSRVCYYTYYTSSGCYTICYPC